jgi:hypothetical protein
VSDVFCCFHRTQHPVRKPKDRVAVTLIQDLKSRCVALCCVSQQLFVCHLVRQSKRSIL